MLASAVRTAIIKPGLAIIEIVPPVGAAAPSLKFFRYFLRLRSVVDELAGGEGVLVARREYHPSSITGIEIDAA